jgi:hypothetical protein
VLALYKGRIAFQSASDETTRDRLLAAGIMAATPDPMPAAERFMS